MSRDDKRNRTATKRRYSAIWRRAMPLLMVLVVVVIVILLIIALAAVLGVFPGSA